jgi:hypothetical protein
MSVHPPCQDVRSVLPLVVGEMAIDVPPHHATIHPSIPAHHSVRPVAATLLKSCISCESVAESTKYIHLDCHISPDYPTCTVLISSVRQIS